MNEYDIMSEQQSGAWSDPPSKQKIACLYCGTKTASPCLDSKQAAECPCAAMPDRRDQINAR